MERILGAAEQGTDLVIPLRVAQAKASQLKLRGERCCRAGRSAFAESGRIGKRLAHGFPSDNRRALTRRAVPAESGAAEGRRLGRAKENMMAKVGSAVLMAAALALGACGTTQGDRAASGAAIGAGTGGVVGLAFGGVGVGAGVFVGAAIGAGTGAFTSERQLDLGKPVWR
jgi:hypothetical protein